MFHLEGIELRFLGRPTRSLVIISIVSTELHTPHYTVHSMMFSKYGE